MFQSSIAIFEKSRLAFAVWVSIEGRIGESKLERKIIPGKIDESYLSCSHIIVLTTSDMLAKEPCKEEFRRVMGGNRKATESA